MRVKRNRVNRWCKGMPERKVRFAEIAHVFTKMCYKGIRKLGINKSKGRGGDKEGEESCKG